MGNGVDYPTEFRGDPSALAATENPNIESGAYATPPALARLLLMYMRGGARADGRRVLSEQAMARAVANRVATAYGGEAAPGVGYGLGWWINRQDGLVYSTGAYGRYRALQMDEGFGYYVVLEANDAACAALAAPLADAVEEGGPRRPQLRQPHQGPARRSSPSCSGKAPDPCTRNDRNRPVAPRAGTLDRRRDAVRGAARRIRP